MKKFLEDNGILVLIIAVLLTALAGVSSLLLGGASDPVSNAVRVLTTPARAVAGAVMDRVDALNGYLTEYDSLQQQVSSLEEENAKLQQENRDAQAATEENARLRSLLNLAAKHSDFVYESCTVTEYAPSSWEVTLTLSKGSSAGIELKDCVITETGALVGVVTQVGTNWATVSAVTDMSTEIGALVSETGSTGVLEGDLTLMQEGTVMLDYLSSADGLQAGNTVLTSGRGGVYPAGLVIGTVKEVKTDTSGTSRYAVVTPQADLESLDEVFVIKSFDVSE